MQSSLPASAPLQEAVFGMVEAIRQSIAAIKGNEATERSTLQSTPCLLPFYYYYTEQLCSSCGPGFSTAHGSHNEVTSPRWSWLGSGAGPAREGGVENVGITRAASRRSPLTAKLRDRACRREPLGAPSFPPLPSYIPRPVTTGF